METSAKKTRSSVNHGRSSKSLEELLRVCKPLFVKMTRLPMSAVDKHATSGLASETKTKSVLHKSNLLWSRGYTTEERRRSRMRTKRKKMLQMEMSQPAANNHTLKGKQINPERTSPSKILNSNDLEGGSSKAEQSAGANEDSTTHSETQSETHGNRLSSNADEVPPVTASNDKLPNATVVTVEEPETNIVDPSSDLIGICLRRSTVRDTAKRKRPLPPIEAGTEESNRSSQDLKKLKQLDDGISPCDEKASPANTKKKEIVPKRVQPSKIVKRNPKSSSSSSFLLSWLSQSVDGMRKENPKSVRRRMNKQREARVVLCRLEDSLDALVRQWNEKRRLLADPGTTASKARPIEERIEETSHQAATNELSGQALPESETSDLPMTNAAPVPCTVQESTNFTPLDEVAKTSGLPTDSDEENDEEVMEFLRSPRKIIPLIDSSSSDSMSYYEESRSSPPARKITRSQTVIGMNSGGISDAEEMTTRRYMTRNAKTPSITRSSPARTRPETRMSRMLRLAKEFAEEVMDSEDSPNSHSEAPKSPRSRGQDPRKTPAPRLTRNKSLRSVVDDSSSESTYNPGEALTDMFDDDVPTPTPLQDQAKSSEVTTLAENPRVDEDNNGPEAIAEVNCDSSPMDDPSDSSNQRNDVLIARKKLTAPNAMVVLTRLDNLDDMSEGNRYSESEMELRTAEDTEWQRERSSATKANLTGPNSTGVDTISNDDETADPLDINADECESAPSETITPFVTVFCRTLRKLRSSEEATRSSPRKLPRIDYFPNDEIDTRWSQDTVESDVELSLILEESERMHDESVARTSGIGDSSVDSLCTPSDGVLTEANGLADNPCRAHDGEDLDEHGKRCPCDEARRDDQRLACENIAATHKCVSCNALFKDAELLARHCASTAACKPDLRCVTCQTTCKTSSELAKHRASCNEKTSENRRSIEDAASSEADIDESHIPPENYASVWLPSKTDPKKSHKKSSKKSRKSSRLRGDNPICNVCSKNFGTTQALSEHIYKHSPEELQEAFRVCKAKLMADFATKRTALEAEANAEGAASGGEVAGTGVVVDGATSTEKSRVTQNCRGTGVVTGADRDALAAAVCPCHRQTQANTEENDLQIEMVLLCQHCHVLFRRRECFEVHYRTSSRCANDRKRGRWPRLFCASCQLTLNSWADMRHHLEVHASVNAEGTVRFVCNICRVVFVGFGALFYYHWFSHLRDTMFVASRHTFPKISVQPIDGLAKLPIGASPEESYIWVAEHVCADCKKPFSTRRDLELHRETDSCARIVNAEVAKDTAETNDSLWYCDVCEIVFDDRDRLNDHGADRHGRHYTCVSTSPKQKTFMCTKCCAMRKRVRDIEEHWKSHPQHNLCHFEMENGAVTARPDDDDVAVISPLAKDNEAVGNSPAAKESCPTGSSSSKDLATITKSGTSSQESRSEAQTSQRSAEKTYAGPAIDIVFQAAAGNPESQNRAARTANEKSLIAETRTDVTSNTSESKILADLLRGTMSAGRSSDKLKTRIGALEDPFVNVVMSDSSNEKLSASLVIDESYNKTRDAPSGDSHTESYQILMMDSNPKSNSGPIKMVFGRKSAANSASKLKQSTDEGGAKEGAKQSSQKKTKGTGSIDGNAAKTTSKKKKNDSLSRPKDNQANVSLPTSSNEKSTEPEIIDIVEEIEITENVNDVPTCDNSSIKVSPAKSTTKAKTVVKSKKSNVLKLYKGVESMKMSTAKGPSKKKSSQNGSSGSEMLMSLNDSGKLDHSDAAALARRGQTLSFEEARYELLSKNSVVDDSAASKTKGFLRVKNLSELQAVVQHVCRICNATFESSASLDEHKLLHFPNTVVNAPGQDPKVITASPVLPDSSVRPKTPGVGLAKNNTVTSSQSYVTQKFATLTPAPSANATGVVNSSEPWTCNANRQSSQISSSLMLNVANGLGALLSKYNVVPDAAKSAITPTAGIAQPQQTIVVQSQPVIGYLSLPDVNRQLPEARNPGQMGYHVLPAMVAPSSQSNRQHTAVASQQNSSSNNLPTSGLAAVPPLTAQINGLNKFLCTICRTFRCDTIEAFNEHVNKHLVGFNSTTASRGTTQTIPAVIVPQSSSFTTVNQVVTNTIADNTTIGTKTTGERLLVNSWILPNAASLWTTSNFNQQSGSSGLPITTQSILPSTVQNTNGKVTNSTTSATVWTPPVYNQSVPSSVDGIMKESLVSPTSQNSNNNNGTTLKPPGWTVPTFDNTGQSNGGQLIYQCTICKSATYTDQEHLRRHILIVHDVENLTKYVMDNVPKTYYCNRCPNGTAPFDLQSKLRIHQETDHSNCCPFCNQNFGSNMFLNDHLEHCRPSNNHANFDGNC